jgi:enterochelin esterase-like enzyme
MKRNIRLLLCILPYLLLYPHYEARADSVCCETPSLPPLASDTDTSFYQYRSGIAHGTVTDVAYTNYLGETKNLLVYLPPGYDSSTLFYPVLYLSHGMGGNQYAWLYSGYADYILDNLIADGKAVPMIIVMPHWVGDNQYFGLRLGQEPAPLGHDDVVTRELTADIIPYIESHYRAKSDRLYRAIAGLSLGGFVSINTGLRRLDLFSEIFAYSPFHNNLALANMTNNFQSIFNDPNTNNERLAVPLYMAMGTSDTLYATFTALDAYLKQQNINHYYVESTGAHEGMNWRRYLHQTAQIMFPICKANHVFTLGPEGASEAHTGGKDNPNAQAGYAKLVTDSGTTPYGTAVFMYRQNGVTISEAGVPASPPTTHARVFIDYRSQVFGVPSRTDSGTVEINTGIAMVNTGHNTANISYTLFDPDGSTLAAGYGTLAVGQHFAKFINYLNEEASGFVLPAGFQYGILDILSDQPLSVLALRGTNNQRQDFLITTTPVADLTLPLSSDPIYFPQFVDGGGYTTSLILMNTSGIRETGRLEIRDGDGKPLTVNRVGGTNDSSFSYSIEPGGLFRFQTDGFPAGIKAGWVRLTPDAGTPTPVGSGVFGYNPSNILVSESGIPATTATTHARVYVDLSGYHNTGVALANISATGADITISAFQKDGATPAGTGKPAIPLLANGYTAGFANGFVEDLPPDFTGVLDISSTVPFAALTLRSLDNERGDFLMTAFPVADATRPAPAPIVFPQIVDGGGYVSQFILLSPEGASDTCLILYGENGILFAAGAGDHKIE